jgi:surface antigen
LCHTAPDGVRRKDYNGEVAVVHSVLSNGAVTIMDVKGDQFMVNGQCLKVYYEPNVVPLHDIDVFTMEEEPERPT